MGFPGLVSQIKAHYRTVLPVFLSRTLCLDWHPWTLQCVSCSSLPSPALYVWEEAFTVRDQVWVLCVPCATSQPWSFLMTVLVSMKNGSSALLDRTDFPIQHRVTEVVVALQPTTSQDGLVLGYGPFKQIL